MLFKKKRIKVKKNGKMLKGYTVHVTTCGLVKNQIDVSLILTE